MNMRFGRRSLFEYLAGWFPLSRGSIAGARAAPSTPRPLFRYPDCVKRYDVLVPDGSGWRRVAGETGNYMRRRVLTFPPVKTDGIRIAMHETHGARSARVYEVRLYDLGGV
jgi:hypothetical protein